jgi:hypothetical protein
VNVGENLCEQRITKGELSMAREANGDKMSKRREEEQTNTRGIRGAEGKKGEPGSSGKCEVRMAESSTLWARGLGRKFRFSTKTASCAGIKGECGCEEELEREERVSNNGNFTLLCWLPIYTQPSRSHP